MSLRRNATKGARHTLAVWGLFTTGYCLTVARAVVNVSFLVETLHITPIVGVCDVIGKSEAKLNAFLVKELNVLDKDSISPEGLEAKENMA
jgi:hypothetical protein